MKPKLIGMAKVWHEIKRPFRKLLHSRLGRQLLRAEWSGFQAAAQVAEPRFHCRWEDRWVCLNDKTSETPFDRHYTYHPAWAARIIAQTQPKRHVDISSSLHFITMISAFVPTEFYDYRPAKLELAGLQSKHADVTALPFQANSIESLSCMHVMEHIGLGRYGDPFDYDGDLKGMRELARVLATGGNLLFVVPVGGEAIIQFNAHRIYTRDMITATFQQLGLCLKEFVLIPEDDADGGLVANPTDELLSRQRYACGCFWLTKE